METKNSGIILVRIERGKDEWQMCVKFLSFKYKLVVGSWAQG